MQYRRVLTVQDISCLGQCSMTVALPILSACGQETVLLPSAVLSSHTGGFGKPHVRDLTADFPHTLEHWAANDIDFDTIYSGYLGSIREIEWMADIFQRFTAPGGKRVVDPAMADHGKLYSGFAERNMAKFKISLKLPRIRSHRKQHRIVQPYRNFSTGDKRRARVSASPSFIRSGITNGITHQPRTMARLAFAFACP